MHNLIPDSGRVTLSWVMIAEAVFELGKSGRIEITEDDLRALIRKHSLLRWRRRLSMIVVGDCDQQECAGCRSLGGIQSQLVPTGLKMSLKGGGGRPDDSRDVDLEQDIFESVVRIDGSESGRNYV